MSNFALIEATLDRQSAAITRMAQRQPHVKYNHDSLWEQVDAAKKELRAAGETVSKNDRSVSFEFSATEFRVGHQQEFPTAVLEKLRAAGIPATGDWMLRGVEYGRLTVTYTPLAVAFKWDSLGQEPEVDPLEELI